MTETKHTLALVGAMHKHKFHAASGEHVKVFVLDLNEDALVCELEAELEAEARISIVISSFGLADAKKIYRIHVFHKSSDATSACSFYGAARDQATLDIRINTKIAKEARRTSSAQVIKGIMLSDTATIKGEPQLIIDDNDVKASHSMGIGQVNEEHLFYLQSRGLTRSQAWLALVRGFFAETIIAFSDEALRVKYFKDFEKLVGTTI